MDAATAADVEKLCESLVTWATEDASKQVSISAAMDELQSRLVDFESTLAAGWRGKAIGLENSHVDDISRHEFQSITSMKQREKTRKVLCDLWPTLILEELTPEENWASVVKPRMLLRAYEVLSERRDVDDDSVMNKVNERYTLWVDMWRQHCVDARLEHGRALDSRDLREYLLTFLPVRLLPFSNGIEKSSFVRQGSTKTDIERIFEQRMSIKEDSKMNKSHSSGSFKGESEVATDFSKAVSALRRAATSEDVRALLSTAWVRSALIDAPKFAVAERNVTSKPTDSGGQMMKDWQREEGVCLRQKASSGKTAPEGGFLNLDVDEWNESHLSTGPFRVHFMRACSEIENALRACNTCVLNNHTEDERREACAKGAARIMFVTSRTMRSGDGLNFIHSLFGQPPEFSVSLVDPMKTKGLIAEHSFGAAPIILEVTSNEVEARCVDVFLIYRHFFAANSNEIMEEDVGKLTPWACIALATSQTFRTSGDGSLRLIRQRIAVDRTPQPALDRFMLDITADRAQNPLTSSSTEFRPPVKVSNDVFAK